MFDCSVDGLERMDRGLPGVHQDEVHVAESRPGLEVAGGEDELVAGDGLALGVAWAGQQPGDAVIAGVGRAGPLAPLAVDEQLAEVPRPGLHLGDGRFPEGTVLAKPGDDSPAANHRFFVFVRLEDNRRLSRARVGRLDHQRCVEEMRAAPHP